MQRSVCHGGLSLWYSENIMFKHFFLPSLLLLTDIHPSINNIAIVIRNAGHWIAVFMWTIIRGTRNPVRRFVGPVGFDHWRRWNPFKTIIRFRAPYDSFTCDGRYRRTHVSNAEPISRETVKRRRWWHDNDNNNVIITSTPPKCRLVCGADTSCPSPSRFCSREDRVWRLFHVSWSIGIPMARNRRPTNDTGDGVTCIHVDRCVYAHFTIVI